MCCMLHVNIKQICIITNKFVCGARNPARRQNYVPELSSKDLTTAIIPIKLTLTMVCCRLILLSRTDRGTVMVWARLMSQQWDVYAPGFRSLRQNEEYVESETEFDMNPKEVEEKVQELDLTCKVQDLPKCLLSCTGSRLVC